MKFVIGLLALQLNDQNELSPIISIVTKLQSMFEGAVKFNQTIPCLLNDFCTDNIQIEHLRLHQFKSNLDDFITKPAAHIYFSFSTCKLKFKFPQPGPIEEIRSKGKALKKMPNCTFTYPVNDT